MIRLRVVVHSGEFVQRALQRLFNDYNNLRVIDLTSNQVVGSSNLSGRAIFQVLTAVPKGDLCYSLIPLPGCMRCGLRYRTTS